MSIIECEDIFLNIRKISVKLRNNFLKRTYNSLTNSEIIKNKTHSCIQQRITFDLSARTMRTIKPICRLVFAHGYSEPSRIHQSTHKILPVLTVCVWGAGGVCDGDFLHLTLCLASYLPSYNPFQPHTCSLLVSHSTFFTLSPPRTPSLTCYLSADLLSPSHWALSPSLSLSLRAFSTRSQMQPSGQGEKMGKKSALYKAAFQESD